MASPFYCTLLNVVLLTFQRFQISFGLELILKGALTMSLIKNQIVPSPCSANNLKKRQAFRVFETFLYINKKSLESGEDALLSGFGRFCVKEKRQGEVETNIMEGFS